MGITGLDAEQGLTKDSPRPRDEELLEAARMGSARGFEVLVERHFGTVYAVAYARMGHRETAEDLAQEVFLRAYLSLDSLRENIRFAAWIVRIAHNLATDWLRRGEGRSRLAAMVPVEEVAGMLADSHRLDPRREAEEEERNHAMREAIFQLPPDQREMVLLHFMEGLNKREIAERLGVHPATVGRHIERAVKGMQKAMAPMIREAAMGLRAPHKATARTVAVIGAASILSATTRSALVASEAGMAKTAVASLCASQTAATSVGFSGLLKSIATVVMSGVKIMGAGKAVGVIAAAAVLGGGVFYYAQENSGAIGKGIQSQEKNPGGAEQAGAPFVPAEINRQLVGLHKQERAKVDPSGALPSICMVNVFRDPEEVWTEALMTNKYKGPTKSGEANMSGSGGVVPAAILNEEGAPLKIRVTKSEPGPFGQFSLFFTLDKPLRDGEERTFCSVSPALKPGRQYYDDTVKVLSDGSYAVTLKQMMGREGIQQHFLLVPPKYAFVKATEEPSLKTQAGEYALYGWTKHVMGQMEGVTVTLRSK